MTFIATLWPEILLSVVACVLLLMGVSDRPSTRRVVPIGALIALIAVFVVLLWSPQTENTAGFRDAPYNSLLVYHFQEYIKMIAAGVGILLVLLAWPTNSDATGNPALAFGQECGEFFGLMLLSIAGIFLVASANDIILLFLGIELASIPTYIMVSISRPLPAAQEAGVKYFFLGAMAAAVMLFGFSYLYGTTGATRLDKIAQALQSAQGTGRLDPWQLMAVVLLLAGFAFKIAAVPLHVYAGDVYEGAATPVTAFLAFVPKTSGFVAIIKVLYYVGGPHWQVPDTIAKLLWVIAVLTMTFGNVLGLLQHNIKRLFAYSSVAHSGYMLVGVTALVSTGNARIQQAALFGVLFYLAAYGIMNTGAFGVLMMLPSRDRRLRRFHGGGSYPAAVESIETPGLSAETFDDIAGQGRRHLALGVAMAVCCWSLTGLPFSVGFFGKVFLILPALNVVSEKSGVETRMVWLVVLTVINAAISAGYYLRIIASMFLGSEPGALTGEPAAVTPRFNVARTWPITASITLSVFLTLVLGIIFPTTNAFSNRVRNAAAIDEQMTMPGASTGEVTASAARP